MQELWLVISGVLSPEVLFQVLVALLVLVTSAVAVTWVGGKLRALGLSGRLLAFLAFLAVPLVALLVGLLAHHAGAHPLVFLVANLGGMGAPKVVPWLHRLGQAGVEEAEERIKGDS